MTHIAYTHTSTVPLVVAMTRWIRRVLPVGNTSPIGASPRRTWPRRLLITCGWLLAVVVQFSLIWLVAEMVQLAHGLMELWLQLATQQLDLVSLYNLVRPGK